MNLNYESPDMQRPRMPGELRAVAWVFLAQGILVAIEMLVALAQGRLSLQLGVLQVLVGIVIFQLNPAWRTCGLFFCWLGMLLMPLVFIAVVLFANAPTRVTIMGAQVAATKGALAFITVMMVVYASINVWQYRVLTRPSVRRLFTRPPVG